jgi:lycopene beta-cyclase
MKLRCDVGVMGSGPAGLALATACAQQGLDVACIAPAPSTAWAQNYGIWAHQQTLVPPEVIAARYPKPRVWLDDDAGLTLPRGYLKLDTLGLQRELWSRAEAAGVRFVDARVVGMEHVSAGVELATDEGVAVHATVGVDAAGAGSPMLAREGESLDAHQTAYGRVIEVAEHPYAEGEMAFMDFRAEPGADSRRAPSFLYALPLDDRHLFVEETALVQKPAMPIDELESRLEARLVRMGLHVLAVHEEERCAIPMGLALPTKTQPLVGFGAAAAMVHPATGYQLASALTLAPTVAKALADGLAEGSPAEASRLAWDAVWPVERARLWSLYRFGMDALCTFDLARTRIFFQSFFALEPCDWQRYLDATASPGELAAIMARLFWGAPLATQWRLLRHGLGAGRGTLWRAASLGGVA